MPGVPVDRILELGAETYPGGDPAVFNMAVMGLRLAQRANGVSVLHGEVSREMFAGLWPGFDTDEVPITSITNGVHAPTWAAPEVLRAGRARHGRPGLVADRRGLGGRSDDVSDQAPVRTSAASCASGSSPAPGGGCATSGCSAAPATPSSAGSTRSLDPDVLTIGFARRVPSYKRLTLMLQRPGPAQARCCCTPSARSSS